MLLFVPCDAMVGELITPSIIVFDMPGNHQRRKGLQGCVGTQIFNQQFRTVVGSMETRRTICSSVSHFADSPEIHMDNKSCHIIIIKGCQGFPGKSSRVISLNFRTFLDVLFGTYSPKRFWFTYLFA